MRIAIIGMMLVLLANTAMAANVIITEVLYDPINSETGGEAVRIYNPSAVPVDIGNWSLATETSAEDATIPAGTVLSPSSYYLVADAGWSTLKDSPEWPAADLEEAITLSNVDAGVALKNGTTIIDAVGWGSGVNIGAGLFEGNPSNGTAPGQSLKRRFEAGYIDTDDNAADFFASEPFSAAASNSITVYAIIEGSAPIMEQIMVADEDSTEPGIQVYPMPKANRQVMVTAVVSDTSAEDIASVSAEFRNAAIRLNRTSANGTKAAYSGIIEVPFYLAPANYSIKVKATDFAALETAENITFQYLSLTGIEFDSATLSFNALPGSTVQLAGDANFGSQNLTIRNIGNTALDFSVSGTDLAYGSSRISAGSMAYTFGNDYSDPTAGILSYAPQHEDVNLGPGENALKGISFKLTVPTTTVPGNYTGSISITAEAS